MSVQLTPILTKFWDHPESWTMATYEDNEGYQALKRAVGMTQAELVDMAKDSGLRGRGGAGFHDGRGDEGVGAGPASLLGLKIANERGWVAPGANADGKDGSK